MAEWRCFLTAFCISTRQRSTEQTAVPELMSGATKRDRDIWEAIIDNTEKELSREPNQCRRQNMQACVEWIKTHGYPEENYNVWGIDAQVKCQTHEGFKHTWAANGYAPRRDEAYVVPAPGYQY
ncbi:hypothetical protein F4779DRAFT_609852 [Xylariaceae sp. FL0662B]|nr:hypothetical protein F4779DRAFT_609852 [Xylariaceae sp. FL0662B]